MKRYLLTWLALQSAALACAATPAASKPEPLPERPATAAASLSDAERYARRCHPEGTHREGHVQGTLLWGTKRDWDSEKRAEESRSVLVSADLASPRQAEAGVKALRLEEGRLVALPDGKGVVGAVLQGTASDGKPVEVAICAAEPAPEDPQMAWYRIEAWNPLAQEWENPCVGLAEVPNPRAVAVSGVWDASGAHHDVPGKLTFACENGALTKCITWGYKPWASHDGHSLADLHQACTRMARADYCGNGHSHTHQGTTIDSYDGLGVNTRTTQASEDFDPTRASFEAAWAPDGATCLARTRDGRPLAQILQECPDRFRADETTELDHGDRCTVQRVDVSPKSALLRNQSYLPRTPAP
jgi:hypothetical protein